MPMTDDGFVFTDADNAVSLNLWAYSSFIGVGCCAIALICIGAVIAHSDSRKHLDRVSFRLVAWALLANMIFGVANGCAGMAPSGMRCTIAVWVVLLTLHLSTFLLFSVALNLQLVLVHGVNGQKMEKWYYICSISLALALTIPPLAAKQYGYDALTDACWYANSDSHERLKWQISTQIFWSVACAFGELVTFITVLVHMLRHQVMHGHVRSRSMSTGTRSRSASVDGQTVPKPPVNVYRGVIMRIALYPFASLVINSITVACDLYASVSDGITTEIAYRVLLLNDFCYGGRSIVYALLAITDPALVRALKSLWRAALSKTDASSNDSSTGAPKTTNMTQTQITVHIELNEIRQLDDGTTIPSSPTLKPMGSDDMPAVTSKDMDSEYDPAMARLEGMRRAQIERAMDMRQEAQERKQERRDFKRQI
ncbi:hypothetical protein CYLTODRAFT_417934 [Cylindrobasidium torrendii FP15055 ss-10]|uniref:G-protein coupled receptors family 2 profile 2 domain-containing protein n=1 Tax=Cylindrobasidium torrendii FP15055 ss-10 TaxID=1314674 RepID=A0A0D7BQA6_9AGAR|nr:hypothetical protein CYLTODRAFT_417934 [Cylindrobasidium torrendii FP15055 ss-10]